MPDPSIEIIARGVFIHKGQLLICKGSLGHLFLPGGHVEFNEPAGDALEREIREELGIELRAGKYLGTCEAAFSQTKKSGKTRRHHEINLVFQLTSPLGSSFDPSTIISQEKHIEFCWMAQAEALAAPLLPQGIGTMIQANGPAWLTLFDR